MAVATLRRGRPLQEHLLSLILTVVSLLLVALPAGVWWRMHSAPKDVARQQAVAIPTFGRQELAAYRRVAATTSPAVPVALAYHDIRRGADADRNPYTVTPEQFAGQMAMLKEAGFRTVDAGQVQRWLKGGELPSRSVAITFDDGTSGLWRYADPVLARLGMRAIAFVVTGSVGQHRPYYLSWNELKRMHDSGRWDIESHTRNGHGLVRTGRSTSSRGPFVINRAWLPKQRRLETISEYETRVRRDVIGSIDDVAAQGLPRPRLFAFPFSAETSPTNDARAPRFVSQLVRQRFAAALSNTEPASWVTRRDRARRVLPRVEVFAGMRPRQLFARMSAAAPLGLARREPAALSSLWVDAAGRPLDRNAPRGATTPVSDRAREVDISDGRVTISPRSSAWLGAFFAPGQMADWGSYSLSARATGLSGGASAGMLVHVGDPTGVITVNVSTGYVSVRAGKGANERGIGNARIAEADGHLVSIEVTGSVLTVAVDGVTVVTSRSLPAKASGGIGLSANAGPSGSGAIQFSDVVIQPTSSSTRS